MHYQWNQLFNKPLFSQPVLGYTKFYVIGFVLYTQNVKWGDFCLCFDFQCTIVLRDSIYANDCLNLQLPTYRSIKVFEFKKMYFLWDNLIYFSNFSVNWKLMLSARLILSSIALCHSLPLPYNFLIACVQGEAKMSSQN